MPNHANPGFFTIFRTGDNDRIFKEMTEGRLRQGWGKDGLNLISENGGPVDKYEWEEIYLEVSGEDPSPQRFAILRRMLELGEGDIVVAPKMPGWNEFTIAQASCGSIQLEIYS